MLKRTLFIASAVLVLGACSGHSGMQSKQAANSNNHGAGYRCQVITVTGSHLPKKVCTTAAQRKAREQASQEMVNRQRAYLQNAQDAAARKQGGSGNGF